MNYNPIILALDYNNIHEAEAMLSKVRPHIGMVKIGTELFSSHGRDAIAMVRDFSIPIFLDVKLHDIPKTVGKTIEVLGSMLPNSFGQHFISIHCFGGREMCRTALEVTKGTNIKPVGITMLSSFDSEDLSDLGFTNRSIGIRTVRMAKVGIGCIDQGVASHPGHPATYYIPAVAPTPGRDPIGMDTFVCPAAQLPLMRKHYEDKLTLISPGIRMEGAEAHDHKSAKPASFALRSGASWIVIGRPITQAPDPVAAAHHFEKVAEKY